MVTENDGTFVGTVNEDFALESNAGDVFLLGNTSWRVHYVRGSEVYVSDADGAPATVPFWLGEAPGRTIELSQEVSRLREEIALEVGSLDGAQARLCRRAMARRTAMILNQIFLAPSHGFKTIAKSKSSPPVKQYVTPRRRLRPSDLCRRSIESCSNGSLTNRAACN